jgi:hypothetical protein
MTSYAPVAAAAPADRGVRAQHSTKLEMFIVTVNDHDNWDRFVRVAFNFALLNLSTLAIVSIIIIFGTVYAVRAYACLFVCL